MAKADPNTTAPGDCPIPSFNSSTDVIRDRILLAPRIPRRHRRPDTAPDSQTKRDGRQGQFGWTAADLEGADVYIHMLNSTARTIFPLGTISYIVHDPEGADVYIHVVQNVTIFVF